MALSQGLFILVVIFSLCKGLSQPGEIVKIKRPTPSQEYVHNTELDEYGKYFLYWTFDDDSVTFEVHVQTHGWVGFGMSPNGGMAGSDIVIGWVDQNGQAHLFDYHATGTTKPVLDESQDWTLLEGKEEGDFTILKFKRKRNTCDEDDRKIAYDTVRAIFAWHETDPVDETDFLQHLSTNRGVKSMQLIDYGTIVAKQQDDTITGLQHFDMKVNNVSLPQQRTTYFCRIMKLPEFKEKQHIVRIEPILDNEAIVHHIVTYFCHGHLEQEEYGRICWEGNMPDNATECSTISYAWAVGQGSFTYPDEAGLSVGGPEDAHYFQIEMHYDNPQNLSGLMDSSGFRFYHTNKLRKYDTGTFALGHGLTWPPMFVPPKASAFQIHAYCSASCTQKLPENGIYVIGTLLHTHLIGRRVWTRHFRGGKELPNLGHDDHYDFNYQRISFFKKPVQILPGDEFHTVCEYNTENKDKVVYGGAGTDDEMCFNFMIYYPKIPITSCLGVTQNYYTVHEYVMHKAMTGDLHINPADDKNVYDYLDELKWNSETIQELQQQFSHMHGFKQYCVKEKAGDGVFGGGRLGATYEKTLPAVDPLYEDEGVCPKTSGSTRTTFSLAILPVLVCAITMYLVPYTN